MRVGKYGALAIILGLLLLASQILDVWKRSLEAHASPPDLERLISQHPDGWHEVPSSLTSPAWKNSGKGEYDIVAGRTYQNAYGQQVMVVMTWSRDGVRRAGHIQQACYNASGFAVSELKAEKLVTDSGSLVLTSFIAKRAGGIEDVVYWRITGGEPDMSNTAAVRAHYLLIHRFDKLKRLPLIMLAAIPDNIMVRVSTMRTNTEQPATAHLAYLKDYLEQLSPADRRLITGL